MGFLRSHKKVGGPQYGDDASLGQSIFSLDIFLFAMSQSTEIRPLGLILGLIMIDRYELELNR